MDIGNYSENIDACDIACLPTQTCVDGQFGCTTAGNGMPVYQLQRSA
ncbi:hypothetical protein [Sphingomonas sp.]|jgi:hypothetical protein|nr:hypothetical protein [Sphingomonas sp.]